MMAWCKTIGKRRELCMDTSVSYIAKPRGAIAFVIKLTVFFLGGLGALLGEAFRSDPSDIDRPGAGLLPYFSTYGPRRFSMSIFR